MSEATAELFRGLHAAGRMLVLPNAWDAGSARVIESCGAEAIATTSAGIAWALGYPDGDVLPPGVLVDAVGRIARVLTVPLTVDAESGYSSVPGAVAETVRALADAGAVGVNLEDGGASPDVLCAKIAAVKRATPHVFVNTRTDVVLRGLVPPELQVAETLDRARRYRDAGCDGFFVPKMSDPTMIAAIVEGTDLPVNVMLVPDLPSLAELRGLGVRRVSAGGAIALAVHGLTRRLTERLLADGGYRSLFEGAAGYPEMNALFRAGE
jgi:2-methylisocitrate lyase-like PEP mutase family enzyme